MNEQERSSTAELRRLLRYTPLWPLLAVSLVLNVWGNGWGVYNGWHADELGYGVATLIEERTINPHYFMYGNITFYRTALGVIPAHAYTNVFDPPPDRSAEAAYGAWLDRHQTRIVTWPRFISAAESVLLVLVTYLIGALLFDRRVGWLAAALLALSPVIVYIAHVATADGFANFALWLACLAAVLGWRQGNNRWWAVAALLAGIAIGAKLDRMLVLIPLAVAYGFRGAPRRRHLALLLLIPAGYLLANPVLLLSPFEFVDGLSRDMFYAAVHDIGTEHPYRTLIGYVRDGTGWPIFVLAAAGLVYAGYALVRGVERRPILWLLATFVPYIVFFGSRATYPWYVAQLLPGLLLLAGYATVRLLDRVPRPYTLPARGALAILLLLALLYPVSVNLQFANDARIAAGHWIEEHVPANATLFVSGRGPRIRAERYQVVPMVGDRERWNHVTEPVDQLEHHARYQLIRGSILRSEAWAGRAFGFPVRDEPYRGWYDVVMEDLETRPVPAEQTQEVLPEWVVIVQGMQPTVLAWLRSPDSGYVQVAEFDYRSLFGRNVRMPMLNPMVWVFQRQDQS